MGYFPGIAHKPDAKRFEELGKRVLNGPDPALEEANARRIGRNAFGSVVLLAEERGPDHPVRLLFEHAF